MTWTSTKSTELDGGVVRWGEFGDGPPIVLVHGTPIRWRSVASVRPSSA